MSSIIDSEEIKRFGEFFKPSDGKKDKKSKESKVDNNYYVYALCNDGVPFYVGKGTGTRCLDHEGELDEVLKSVSKDKASDSKLDNLLNEVKESKDEALDSKLEKFLNKALESASASGDEIFKSALEKENSESKEFESEIREEYDNKINEVEDAAEKAKLEKELENKLKRLKGELTNKLKEILIARTKGTFNIIIIKFGLTEPEAFMVESAVINALDFCGIKFNDIELANAVNGHANKKEKETKVPTKARTLVEFLRECCPPKFTLFEIDEILKKEDIGFDGNKDEVVFIDYHQSYPLCKTGKAAIDIDTWDAVRGCWDMGEEKGKKVKYIFAVANNFIRNIFKVKKDGEFADFQKINSATKNFPDISDSNITKNGCRQGDIDAIDNVRNLLKENPSLKGKSLDLALVNLRKRMQEDSELKDKESIVEAIRLIVGNLKLRKNETLNIVTMNRAINTIGEKGSSSDKEAVDKVIKRLGEEKLFGLVEPTYKTRNFCYRGFFACDINDFEGDDDLKSLRKKFRGSRIETGQLNFQLRPWAYLSNGIENIGKKPSKP